LSREDEEFHAQASFAASSFEASACGASGVGEGPLDERSGREAQGREARVGVESDVAAAVAAAEAEFATLAAAEAALGIDHARSSPKNLRGATGRSSTRGGEEPGSPGIVARGEEALRAAEDAMRRAAADEEEEEEEEELVMP
jgi:hypothetical protein